MNARDQAAHEKYLQYVAEVQRIFSLGCRVRLTEVGVAAIPRYANARGTVVGHRHSSPKVLWDGRRTWAAYAPWFLRRARQ